MFDHSHYVPILRAKQGEFWALSELSSEAREGLTPLIEATYLEAEGDGQGSGVDPTLIRLVRNLKRFWGRDAFFLDLGLVASDPGLAGGVHPAEFVFGELRSEDLEPIPVTSLRRDEDHQEAVGQVVSEDGRGFCARLDTEDFEEIEESIEALEELMDEIGTRRAEVDLLLDLGEIEARQVGALSLVIQGVLSAIPSIDEWRSLTVASTSFPSVAGFSADTTTPTARSDWSLWRRLVRRDVSRRPAFADYGVVGAQLPGVGTAQFFQPSPNLRYTTADEYLVLKARHPRYGNEQFNALCAALVGRSEYAGPDFSAGDRYINGCANGTDGPGNAAKWIQAGTNHHLEAVVDQIANHDGA